MYGVPGGASISPCPEQGSWQTHQQDYYRSPCWEAVFPTLHVGGKRRFLWGPLFWSPIDASSLVVVLCARALIVSSLGDWDGMGLHGWSPHLCPSGLCRCCLPTPWPWRLWPVDGQTTHPLLRLLAQVGFVNDPLPCTVASEWYHSPRRHLVHPAGRMTSRWNQFAVAPPMMKNNTPSPQGK